MGQYVRGHVAGTIKRRRGVAGLCRGAVLVKVIAIVVDAVGTKGERSLARILRRAVAAIACTERECGDNKQSGNGGAFERTFHASSYGSAASAGNTERGQIRAQLRHIFKHDAQKPRSFGGEDVALPIVDENSVLGLNA